MSFPIKPCESIIRTILDYPNYKVDIYGNFYGLHNKKLKGNVNKYIYIHIKHNKKLIHLPIHRCVAGTFIPNPFGKNEVDHINNNPLDNRVENLRWTTSTENKMNRKHQLNSSNDVRGLTYKKVKQNEYWFIVIQKNKKKESKHFPYTEEGKIKAIKWRVCKEIEIFKEYASKI